MINTKITFRNASLGDISKIMNIEHSSFGAGICEEEKVFAERISTFPDGFRVMDYDGKIIGYICSELWEKTDELSQVLFTLGHSIKGQHVPHGKEVYISSMGIMPEYRSLGLGKTMFDAFISHITAKLCDIESIILVVSENWHKARRIYSKNGFKEIDRLDGFFQYGTGTSRSEDGIIMRRHFVQ